MTYQDTQVLMTQLGVQVNPPAGFSSGGTLTPEEQATRQAQIQTCVTGNPTTAATPGAQPSFQGTSAAGFEGRGGGFGGGFGRGFGAMFVGPVVRLLPQRAGS